MRVVAPNRAIPWEAVLTIMKSATWTPGGLLACRPLRAPCARPPATRLWSDCPHRRTPSHTHRQGEKTTSIGRGDDLAARPVGDPGPSSTMKRLRLSVHEKLT